MRFLRHPLAGILMSILILSGFVACSSEEAKPAPRTAPTVSPAEMEMRQQLVKLQSQIIAIDEQIANMRTQHSQSMDDLYASITELSNLADQVQRNLAYSSEPVPIEEPSSGDRLIEETRNDKPITSKNSPGFFPRLILVIIILLAVWFLARIFLGRMDDEDEFADEVYMGPHVRKETPEGTITLSPQAAAAAEPEPAKETTHGRDDDTIEFEGDDNPGQDSGEASGDDPHKP